MSGFSAPPDVREEFRFRAWLQALARKFWTIPEYTVDPPNPNAGDLWVRYSGGNYELSYRTNAGTTVRETLT